MGAVFVAALFSVLGRHHRAPCSAGESCVYLASCLTIGEVLRHRSDA